VLAAALIGMFASAGSARAAHLDAGIEGHTALEAILAPDDDPGAGYTTLGIEDVEGRYLVRDGASEGDGSIPNARPGREGRRRSLTYISQMTDYQLADEESPARVEFLDAAASAAWRPWEALIPFSVDRSIRQVNRFAAASPVPQGDGTSSSMDFALLSGDHADNQQLNEAIWVRDLLEGNGPLRFNSGLTDPDGYSPAALTDPACQEFVEQDGGPSQAAAEGARYTGVQDYDDYPAGEGPDPAYYDPDDVQGTYAERGWPAYDELMDAAQTTPIDPAGLEIPFYVANGNHDVLVQGNEDATDAFEAVATGCRKLLSNAPDADAAMLVPPDQRRRFVSKPQIKAIYAANDPIEQHGFGFVDRDEEEFSDGAASYYAWDPPQAPGMRFIAVDTTSEGGVAGPSSNGNIDDPQFEWLQRELDAAQLAGKLIVLFGHHPVRTMDAAIPDEAGSPCTLDDEHGHDVNPGCDLDPRSSEPLHFGDPETAEELESDERSFTELLAKYPNVVAYVAGHTHENRIRRFENESGSVWWEITTSAVADFPQQHRLVELMDNGDETLSIFGTLLDHASPATAPTGGNASAFDAGQLGSIGRTLAFNDPQSGAAAAGGQPAGAAEDGNVELLLDDPRDLECRGHTATIVGSDGSDRIDGTKGRDVILALGGNDKVRPLRGKDLVCGGKGEDKLKGGRGSDELAGEAGPDKLKAGKGRDKLSGGKGRDRLKGGKGRDRLRGGKGRDSCKGGGSRDRASSC